MTDVGAVTLRFLPVGTFSNPKASEMFMCNLGKGLCRMDPGLRTIVILGEHLGRHMKALNLGREGSWSHPLLPRISPSGIQTPY